MVDLQGDSSPNAGATESMRLTKSLSLWIRRCHLFLGLFLVPWALLYGVTGYLFNHPTHFSDRGLKEISRATLVQSGFAGSLPDPQEAAQEVVALLNERFPEAKLELMPNPTAEYVGDFFFATANGKEKTYQLLIRRDGGGGTYLDSTIPQKPSGPTAAFVINPRGSANIATRNEPLPSETVSPEPLRITRGIASQVEEILPTLAQYLETPGLDVPFRLTSAPQLQFRVTSGDNQWMVKYDSFHGGVSAEWVDPTRMKEPLSWRTFMLRLHTTHGYSGIYEARWFWAITVDVMSFVLIFWALSGVWMWWQIKRLRNIGWSIIAASLLIAGLLFLAMAYELG